MKMSFSPGADGYGACREMEMRLLCQCLLCVLISFHSPCFFSQANKAWDTSDIQDAIRDLEQGGGIGEVSLFCRISQKHLLGAASHPLSVCMPALQVPLDKIEFDPIYDDIHYG
jgi:hypothetical protein